MGFGKRVALIVLGVGMIAAGANHFGSPDFPLGGAEQGAGVWNWVRLPFQAVFIAWAWWFTRPDPAPTP